MEEDQGWLLAVIERRSKGDPWQAEISRFLRGTRGLAERVVGAVQQGMRVQRPRRADAEDIIALADAKFVMRGLDLYRGDALPRTYYLNIIKNAAIGFYRRAATHLEITEAAIATVDDPSPIQRAAEVDTRLSEAERAELARDLVIALAELYRNSPPHAEAIDLFLYEVRGSAADCAKIAGITVGNFNKRVERGRKLLQQILIRMGHGDDEEVN